MKKRKLCTLALLLVTVVLAATCFWLSFESAASIDGIVGINGAVVWRAVDYWLAWFSALSIVGGVAFTVISIPALMDVFDGLCG